MALFEEQITDTLETGAPSIKYTGKEGPRPSMQSQEEMMIARQIWDAMGDEEKGQFSNFEEFFASGIWKQILQQMQQDEGQGIASLGPQGPPGIAGLGPRNMEQQMPVPNRMGAEFGGRIGYADGLDWKSKEERGPLYIDENYDLDVPLTEFEKELRMLKLILNQRGNIGRVAGVPGGGKTGKERRMELLNWGTDRPSKDTGYFDDYSMRHRGAEYLEYPFSEEHYETGEHFNRGGRTGIESLRGGI